MKYLWELFARVLSGENASSILSGLSPQVKGHTGEGLLRLLTLLGIHPTDPSSTVIPYTTVPSSRRLIPLASIADRLEILKNGLINSGGANKIDVCWADGTTRSVCSSKIGKIHIKSIADLEIGAMLTEFTESGGYTENGKSVSRESIVPYVLVDTKAEVFHLAEKSKASNKVSKDNLNPLDVDDLNRMCSIFLGRMKDCPKKDLDSIVSYLLSDEKPSIRIRFHQYLICSKILKCIQTNAKVLLIGALPRSGKTYMGAYISKHFKRVLIITTRPTETKPQWLKVFNDHKEFSDYKVKDLDSSTASEVALLHKKKENVVAVSSIQFFKMDERESLLNLEWDIVLLDEIHEGGSTDLSNSMLDTYIGTKPIRIMMTATYTKPVDYYSIPEECCNFWDLEDVRLMREWGTPEVFSRLCEKYGKGDVENARDYCYSTGETDDSIRSVYKNAPKLGILTNTMQAALYDELRVSTNSPDNIYGFSMRSLFMTTENGKAFQNQGAVDTFLALLSGSEKMKHYKKGDMSMFARILRYWKLHSHRDGDEFMTQIWFLPSGVGQLLENVKAALISRINANKILKQFDTLTLDSGMGDISKAVHHATLEAKEKGKKGLILLTGNVGNLGVSLPEVDVAFMLHDIESADTNYQQMMRVLTEMMNKKYGLVVDFNVWRVLTTLNTYATSRCGKSDTSSSERISWCVSHLIDVDPDLWECKESPETFPQHTILSELTQQWRNMIEKTLSTVQSLSKKKVDLGEDQKELDTIAKYLEETTSSTSLAVNPDQEKLQSGVERRVKDPDLQESVDEEEEEVVDKLTKKANLNDVLSRLIPEIAILSGSNNLLQAISIIHQNPIQRAALNDFIVNIYA
jgi:superfamily II DNA or RNA helicase